jgi:hypothetical protein
MTRRYLTTRDIVVRCDRESERMEIAGQGDAANTLYMAARELERLKACIAAWEADNARRYSS